MAGGRAGWLRFGAVLGATAALVAGNTAAAWEPPRPEPVLLRLDDSPALPLLAPFRHAAGRPSSHLRRYLDGRFSRWRERSWHTLAWCPGAPAASAPPGDLGGPALTCVPVPFEGCPGCATSSAAPWADWLIDDLRRWPLVTSAEHWFQPAPVDLVAAVGVVAKPRTLSIAEDVLPPWLQRLDAGTAQSLVETFGCGRGGPCSAGSAFPAQAFEQLWSALSPKRWPIPEWQCRPREVTVRAHGREADRFQLMNCDGSIPAEALDRLSILARPVGVARPVGELPDEPDPAAGAGEWLPRLRIVHPRLLWLLQRVANEFPWRAMYIYSGYRPAPAPPAPGTRSSYHWQGRALDVAVHGVPNEELFQLCRDLPDVGCGYYPNKPFVHLDVRPRGFGSVFWIDAAPPGESPRYVSSWPGVADEGAIGWAPPP